MYKTYEYKKQKFVYFLKKVLTKELMFVYNMCIEKMFARGGLDMKIVNKKKFLATNIVIMLFIFITLLFISKCTLSHADITYTKTYIEFGDTLWNIAQEQQNNNNYYKDKEIREIINDIKKVNNLKSCNLSVGQEIKIPTI